MVRTGDQSLCVPNGIGDMATALNHAIELENRGIIPYTIDEQGIFKSNMTYPRMCIFTKDAMFPVSGDTLLEVRAVSGDPILKYESHLQKHYLYGSNGVVKVFDGGQPLTGQTHQPIVDNIDKCKGVHVLFEVYGPKYRKALIDFRDKTKSDFGLKLSITSQNKTYQAFGCNNSGFIYENNIIHL